MKNRLGRWLPNISNWSIFPCIEQNVLAENLRSGNPIGSSGSSSSRLARCSACAKRALWEFVRSFVRSSVASKGISTQLQNPIPTALLSVNQWWIDNLVRATFLCIFTHIDVLLSDVFKTKKKKSIKCACHHRKFTNGLKVHFKRTHTQQQQQEGHARTRYSSIWKRPSSSGKNPCHDYTIQDRILIAHKDRYSALPVLNLILSNVHSGLLLLHHCPSRTLIQGCQLLNFWLI